MNPTPRASNRPKRSHARAVVYAATLVAAVGELVFAWLDKDGDAGAALLEANQLIGLTAFGFLLATVAVGPLLAVFPKTPLRADLQYGRRALGVSTCALGLAHAGLYLTPSILRDWHELLEPGATWVLGLALGAFAAGVLLVLAVTSRDAAVRRMGGRPWKRLHRWIYPATAVVFVHALLLGSDFGLRPYWRGVEGDGGCLAAFSAATAAWIVLFVLRARRRRSALVRVNCPTQATK